MTEKQALRLLRNGSEDALGWFISQYTPYVTTIIHNIIGAYMDIADVEEVASDVFFALWENAGKVFSVKAYLGALARNKAKNKLREFQGDLSLSEDLLVMEELTPEDRLEKQEPTSAVRRAVDRMREPDREIFLRYYYYYQTMEAISREMAMPLATVKTRLRRGKLKLKQSLLRYLT